MVPQGLQGLQLLLPMGLQAPQLQQLQQQQGDLRPALPEGDLRPALPEGDLRPALPEGGQRPALPDLQAAKGLQLRLQYLQQLSLQLLPAPAAPSLPHCQAATPL